MSHSYMYILNVSLSFTWGKKKIQKWRNWIKILFRIAPLVFAYWNSRHFNTVLFSHSHTGRIISPSLHICFGLPIIFPLWHANWIWSLCGENILRGSPYFSLIPFSSIVSNVTEQGSETNPHLDHSVLQCKAIDSSYIILAYINIFSNLLYIFTKASFRLMTH